MLISGIDLFLRHLNGELFQIKVVANEKGFVFGPVERQHVELGTEGVQYRPDGKGNAVAGMLYSGKIEFRNDPRFSEARLRTLVQEFLKIFAAQSETLSTPAAQRANELKLFYAGKPLN
jgi:hypothetical protein